MKKKDENPRAATLIDVARLAGVSVSTAARVLRNAAYPVTDVMRERVQVAARHVGYVPNQLARSLRGAETTYIGLIVGNMQEPYFGSIAEAVTDEARLLPGIAIVSNMQRNPRLELELCKQLWEHRVKGLILAGGSYDQRTHHAELQALLSSMTQANVAIASMAERDLDIPTFAEDNEQVGICMANSVLSKGHREIGLVFGSRKSLTTQQRLKGINKEKRQFDAVIHQSIGDYSFNSAGTAAEDLIRKHPGITAFLCGTDSMAVGAMQRLQQLGFRIPEDISIVGIGNTNYAQLVSPRLSSVDINLSMWARRAVRFIGSRLRGAPAAPGPEDTADGRPLSVSGSTICPPAPQRRLR